MLKRLLTAAATIGLLVCGATVGLEAVGVLFNAGSTRSTPDPERQHVEAFLARLEAEFNPADLPTEPVEFPTDETQEAPTPNAEAVAPSDLTPHADGRVAEGPPPADPVTDRAEHVALAPTGKVEGPLPEGEPQPEAGPEPAQPAPEPEPHIIREAEPGAAPSPAQIAAQTTDTPAAVPATRPQRRGGAARARGPQVSTGRYVSFGCPFLDWLDALIDPAAAQVADRPVAAWCPG